MTTRVEAPLFLLPLRISPACSLCACPAYCLILVVNLLTDCSTCPIYFVTLQQGFPAAPGTAGRGFSRARLRPPGETSRLKPPGAGMPASLIAHARAFAAAFVSRSAVGRRRGGVTISLDRLDERLADRRFRRCIGGPVENARPLVPPQYLTPSVLIRRAGKSPCFGQPSLCGLLSYGVRCWTRARSSSIALPSAALNPASPPPWVPPCLGRPSTSIPRSMR